MKAEYLRPVPPRVSLDEAGRSRGMNRGKDRAHSVLVTGTERPTFEGEENFFAGPTLQKIKQSVRTNRHDGKRPRPPSAREGQSMPTNAVVGSSPAEDEGWIPPITGSTATTEVEATKASEVPYRMTQSEERLRDLISSQRAKARGIFSDQLFLAPLTTVGNLPFRRICKAYGADVTVSEMAVAFNLNRLQKSEWSLLRRHVSEDIFGIQVAVSHPREAVTVSQALEASEFSYDFLDINCGCPVEKIVKSGCGCGLWERKGRLREVVQSFTQYQSRPVSLKCRIGPDEETPALHRQIHEYADWGASALTIHGRSRKQRYTKLANWNYVQQCSTLTSLPIVGNGDILGLEDVEAHRRDQPGIGSFMIGRGALIKPWIFEEIKSGQVKDISSSERFEMLQRFCRYGLAHWGADERGVMNTRRFLCEWLSFLHRYVPVGLLERLPQRMNERPPYYEGRDALETLMSSDSVTDWIRISEMLLGPVETSFKFTPKHKSNSYTSVADAEEAVEG